MHRPFPCRQCDSAYTVSSRRVSWLCLAILLGLLLQSPRPVQGQSRRQQESAVCTIQPRPILVGLTATPEDDRFGYDTSLSLDGTIAAIGARSYGNDDEGYVQVFRFENNAWVPLGSTIFGDPFSETTTNALSDDGSNLAVGGLETSIVRVFRLVNDEWEPLGNDITNPSGNDIGFALAISGDGTILAASSPHANSEVGEVQVFEWVGGVWSQKGSTLQGQGEEINFGYAISLSQDGSRLAVGIPDEYDGETNGFVRVFEFNDNDWVQIGQTLQGANVGVWFGEDVSLSSDGGTLAVGSSGFSDESSIRLGTVHVYHFGDDDQWFQPGTMLIGKSREELFGEYVRLSGDASILVARGVRLLRFFKNVGNEWIKVGEEATYSTLYNYAAISRDGSTAAGGANVFDISCTQGTTPAPASPFVSTPPMTPAPVFWPTSAPVDAPEETPIAAATTDPVFSPPPPTTPAPVPLPTTAPVEAPVETPRTVPVLSPSPTGNTDVPVDNPTPTDAETMPTGVPQTKTVAGTMVKVMFSDITLSFNNVSLMSGAEIGTFERLTKMWYETFFIERSGRVLQSLLLDARHMQTTIEVTEQNVYLSENDSLLVNNITYNQTIAYTAESNNVDANDYITLPFVDITANTEYGETLKSQMVAFQGLQSPFPIPQFESLTDASGDENDGKGSAIGVIVGASIGGAVFLAIALFVGIRVKKQNEDAGVSVRAVQQSNTPMECPDQTHAQRASFAEDFHGQRLASAAGVIIYDEQGEVLAPRALAAQAVLLASDNPTTLQKDSTEVQTPSAGLLKPSPPQHEIDAPAPEPTVVLTPPDGYAVQFKDQTRSVEPEMLAQRDP